MSSADTIARPCWGVGMVIAYSSQASLEHSVCHEFSFLIADNPNTEIEFSGCGV
jgi:hypothetical protein